MVWGKLLFKPIQCQVLYCPTLLPSSLKLNYMHFIAFTPRAHASLHGSLVGGQVLSYKHKFQISLRSELPLRRYLQNNIDFMNTLIFDVFSIFSQFHTSKVFQSGKLLNDDRIYWKLDIKMSKSNEEKDTCPILYAASQPEQ